MILLTLSRGKGEETVRLQLPASPAEIGETFAFLDRISLDTTATAILDVSSNVPVLYRCLYDVDVEDSEQFQKLQKLAERTEALSPAKAAIFSGALDAECVWNLEGALTVADRLDEYMLVNNVSSDSELGIYLVNKGIIPFPDRFKPYINYARVGAEYREKHGGEYSSGNYVQKKTPELLENERLDGVFRIWMENPCPVRVQSETAQITLPATFEQLESARQLLGVDSLNMAKLTRVEALRPYLGEYLPLQGMDLRLEQLDELAENIRIVQPIRAGDEITESMVQIVEVGGYNLPEDVLRQKESAVGKYATADLAVGDYIIPSKLSDAPAAENAYLYSLDGSQQAISVSIKSFAEGLSGKLQSGDIVSVIAPDYKQQGQTVVPAELQYVEIISVTASSGYDANTGEPVDEEDDKELPDTVTLLVSPEQAKVLAELEAEGTIHLALVYRGDRENADKFLTSQDEIILELYPPEPDPEEKPQENPAESEPAADSSETAETEAPAKTEEVA